MSWRCVLAKGRFASELNLMLKYSDAPVEEKKKQVILHHPVNVEV